MENAPIRNALIALIKAHNKIGRVSWFKMSDTDTARISESGELIRTAIFSLTGRDTTLGDVMKAFNITDAEVYE